MKRFSTLNHSKSSSFVLPDAEFKKNKSSNVANKFKKLHLRRFVDRRFIFTNTQEFEPSKGVIDRIMQYAAALEVFKTSHSVCFKILN